MANGSTSSSKPTGEALTGRFEPRTGAKALVTGDSAVLLVRERHSDGSPFWTLPGGGVRTHESHTEGLRRELLEELGCRARIADPLSTFWYAHDSHEAAVSTYAVFECSLHSTPTPNPAEGVFETRWIEPGECPPTTLPQVRYLCTQLLADG